MANKNKKFYETVIIIHFRDTHMWIDSSERDEALVKRGIDTASASSGGPQRVLTQLVCCELI